MDYEKHSNAVQSFMPDMGIDGTQAELLPEFIGDGYKKPLIKVKNNKERRN